MSDKPKTFTINGVTYEAVVKVTNVPRDQCAEKYGDDPLVPAEEKTDIMAETRRMCK